MFPLTNSGFFGGMFRSKYSNKLILEQNSEIYARFAPGLLNVNKLFCSDANSPQTALHMAKRKE